VRLLWHSNAPWVPTGYGQQTALFAPRLRELGHDVAISANWGLGGAGLEWRGMHVYPADERWGNRTLAAFAAHHGGSIEDCQVVTLMDVWVLDRECWPDGMRLACWTPVDHEPVPDCVRGFFGATGATPIAMSRFGERELRRAGFDPLYVPHGVDTEVFRPMDGDRDAIRAELGVPAGAFVVGMVAANKGHRKSFPQVFQAFARLRERHPDALLYLHCERWGNHAGTNLPQLARACGLPPRAVRYTDSLALELGLAARNVAPVYAMMDVLANPSFGEGFGIPIVEAQACGTPAVVTDHSAMTELAGPGWLVGGDAWYDAPQDSFFRCPSVAEIAAALEEAYARRGDAVLRARAREFALRYDAGRVVREHWAPALAALGEGGGPREVAPLDGGRVAEEVAA